MTLCTWQQWPLGLSIPIEIGDTIAKLLTPGMVRSSAVTMATNSLWLEDCWLENCILMIDRWNGLSRMRKEGVESKQAQ
jgi:hypothetical protein